MSIDDIKIDYESVCAVLKVIDDGITANNALTDTDPNKASNLAKLWTDKSKHEKKKKLLEKKLNIDYDKINKIEADFKAEIEEWVERERVHYVSKGGGHWVRWINENYHFSATEAMKREYYKLNDSDYYSLFDSVLDEKGHKVIECTYKWTNKPIPRTLNLLDWNFLEPVVSDEQHWFFNAVISSICGAKAENIEHVERLILNKYLHPEDNMLPALVLNDKGRTGKGLLAERILPTLFGKRLVKGNIDIMDFIGQFNASCMGKAVLVINEAKEHEKIDMNALKSKLMTTTVTMEEKYQPKMEVDATNLTIILSNELVGAIKVTGSPTDERLSIVNGGKAIYELLVNDSRLDLPNKSVLVCKEWIKEFGAPILSDPEEVGKWLYSLIVKYGEVKNTTCLHGEDYKKLLDVQRTLYIEIIEKVFNPATFNYVKKKVLYDVYVHLHNLQSRMTPLGRNKFYALVDDWLANNEPTIIPGSFHLRDYNNQPRGSLDVWHLSTFKPTIFNDLIYIEYQPDGKVKQVNVAI